MGSRQHATIGLCLLYRQVLRSFACGRDAVSMWTLSSFHQLRRAKSKSGVAGSRWCPIRTLWHSGRLVGQQWTEWDRTYAQRNTPQHIASLLRSTGGDYFVIDKDALRRPPFVNVKRQASIGCLSSSKIPAMSFTAGTQTFKPERREGESWRIEAVAHKGCCGGGWGQR